MTEATLETILAGLPRLRIAVIGDLFLDRYLDLDAALTEPSIETGLDAYQVARVRSYPGAAGTVINNLASLGVGTILPIAVIGDDGEGYELRQALARMPAVRQDHVVARSERRTPTYTKPMLCEPGEPPRELNRLDIKNRSKLPVDAETAILAALDQVWPTIDALLVLDQVSEPDCGVVTENVRRRLSELGAGTPGKWTLADSRARIGMFRNTCLKPNVAEARQALGRELAPSQAAAALAEGCGRPVFLTCGAEGIWVAAPDQPPARAPAATLTGPIDPVGAGDSTSAGLACALATGATLHEAAEFANLVASITIQQIGATGTATPDQVRQRWRVVSGE
ncbi:MAG: PfkB family carbohydrate kinase [Gemmataceae bacterium]|nr:PfkB family carbohydrate kinase [Gemmataceae bacterium]